MPEPKIETPCIKVCAVDGASGLCLGCGRTLMEIGGWVQLGPEGRRAVMDALPARLANLKAKEPAEKAS